jgi:hypothetical protein
MRDPTERPRPLTSRTGSLIDIALTMPRTVWYALKAFLYRLAIRPIMDARREHALRRARYWGTYS